MTNHLTNGVSLATPLETDHVACQSVQRAKGTLPREKVMRSIELFGEYVLLAFR